MNFNEWLAYQITKRVGTMGAAYLFALLALVELPAALSTKSVIVIISWLAQTFLQLVLLPVIIVGQNLQAQKHDELHAKISMLHKHVKEIHKKLGAGEEEL